MNKTARRVLVTMGFCSIVIMGVLSGVRIYRTHVLRQRVEKIREFALQTGVMLKPEDERYGSEISRQSIKSETDIALAQKVFDTLCRKNLSVWKKLDGWSLERIGNKIVSSANFAGEYQFKGSFDGDAVRDFDYTYYEFNENGTRKRVLIPAGKKELDDARDAIRNCILSCIGQKDRVYRFGENKTELRNYEDVGELKNHNILSSAEEKVDVEVNLTNEPRKDCFVKDDFLYLSHALECEEKCAMETLFLLLFFFPAIMSFIFYRCSFLRAFFAGVAVFMVYYILDRDVYSMIFMLLLFAAGNAFLFRINSKYLTGLVLLLLSMYLGHFIMGSLPWSGMYSPYEQTVWNTGYMDCGSAWLERLIKLIVSAINIFACAVLLDCVGRCMNELGLNPVVEGKKQTVYVELSPSLTPSLGSIKLMLSRYVNDFNFFVVNYDVSINRELKENEYRLIKNEKVVCSKVLKSSEMSGMDLDTFVGAVIIAKRS
ncbi:MAG: hypothetical protein IIU30_05190 [Treponema sp.]|nr:hypothetical protein [Treponema sp.]